MWYRDTRYPRVFSRVDLINGPPDFGVSHQSAPYLMPLLVIERESLDGHRKKEMVKKLHEAV